MIEINLLPPELRPSLKILEFSKEFVTLVSMALLLILVTVSLLVAGFVAVQEGSLKKWKRALAQIEVPRQELQQLKKRIRDLQDQTGKARELLHHPILWSVKLNQISDLLQPGVWLIQLTLQSMTVEQRGALQTSEFYLVIKGRAYSRTQEEAAQVGRYISALKADQDFFNYFKDIQLENIQGRPLGGINVAEFTLSCPLKSDKAK